MAARPFGTSENFKPREGERNPDGFTDLTGIVEHGGSGTVGALFGTSGSALGSFYGKIHTTGDFVRAWGPSMQLHRPHRTLSLLTRIRGKYLFGNRTEAVVKLTTGSEAPSWQLAMQAYPITQL